jgi:hypothetical protein
MQRLKKALAAGYGNRAELEHSPDFEALRDREDFKKLLFSGGAAHSHERETQQ